MGSPSGEVRLCYKLVPTKIRATATDRVDLKASQHLRRLLGADGYYFGGKEQAESAGSSGEDAGNCPEMVSTSDAVVSDSGLREMSSAAIAARSTTSKLERQCAEVVDRIDSYGWIDVYRTENSTQDEHRSPRTDSFTPRSREPDRLQPNKSGSARPAQQPTKPNHLTTTKFREWRVGNFLSWLAVRALSSWRAVVRGL